MSSAPAFMVVLCLVWLIRRLVLSILVRVRVQVKSGRYNRCTGAGVVLVDRYLPAGLRGLRRLRTAGSSSSSVCIACM